MFTIKSVHSVGLFLVGLVAFTGAFNCKTADADPQWNDFQSWTPMTIPVDWSPVGPISPWAGPLIADVDGDAHPEVIVVDNRTISVYPYDAADADHYLYRIDASELDPAIPAHYYFRTIPSVGDIDGDGEPEIVATCDYIHSEHVDPPGDVAYNFQTATSIVLVFEGTDGSELVRKELQAFRAETPVLADIDVLEYDPEAPSYEDGQMELVLAGYSYLCEVATPPELTHYSLYSWKLYVLQFQVLNGVNTLVTTDRDTLMYDFEVDLDYNYADRSGQEYRIAAVGDMDSDGLKEIGMSYYYGFRLWTYDPRGDNYSKLSAPLISLNLENIPRLNAADCGFNWIGPVMADMDNDGQLEVIVTKYNWNGGLSPMSNKVWVLKKDGTDLWANVDEIVGTDYDFGETPMISDLMSNGLPYLTFHLDPGGDEHSYIFCRDYLGQRISEAWPESFDFALGQGINFASADLDYGDYVNILSGGKWWANDNLLHIYTVESGLEDEKEFDGVSEFSAPAITDMDSDGKYEAALWSKVTDDEMNVRIWETDVSYYYYVPVGEDMMRIGGNELSKVEWSQLGNGPRHTGLYAQPYTDLPFGTTYWRDRVIVADDIWLYSFLQGGGANRLNITDGTVVEFNDEKAIHNGRTPGYLTIGRNVEFKPNSDEAGHGDFIIYHPMLWEDGFMDRGVIVLDSGDVATFTNCSFSGIGDNTAISATNATVNLIGCSIIGYSTGVLFDNCAGSIEGCLFEDMTYNAIELRNISSSQNFVVQDCQIASNGGSGIYLYNSSPTLQDNEITLNNCAVTGSAIYCYNSSPTLKNNNVYNNSYNGIRATAGGTPFMTNGSAYFRNRFANNNTVSHTPRSANTWAEMIRYYPSSFAMNVGHNDVINTNGGVGDYLMSRINGGSTLTATYNYWQTPGTLGPEDFSPSGSVTYQPKDQNPNHIDDIDELAEELAEELYLLSVQAKDSGNYEAAYDGFIEIVSEYPETSAALSALRQVYECAEGADVSKEDLYRYFGGVAGGGGALGIYADRLATLCLVDVGDFDTAIKHYEEVLADISGQDSLYYAIDCANARLQQAQANDGEVGDAVGNRRGELASLQRDLMNLTARLNGMPEPFGDASMPEGIGLITAYPNPFNSVASINYTLKESGVMQVAIYDISGRNVAVLQDGWMAAGKHDVVWDASQFPSGVYICRLNSGGVTASTKLTLVR